MEDDDGMPFTDEELEQLLLRSTVAGATAGDSTPDPRPRKDSLVDAYGDVVRLVAEVRRHRRREERWKNALRAALADGDPAAQRRAMEDVLDDAL